MEETRSTTGGWIAGGVVTVVVHVLLFGLLYSAMAAAPPPLPEKTEVPEVKVQLPRRRGAFGPARMGNRRYVDGLIPRKDPIPGMRYGRRDILSFPKRREADSSVGRTYRNIQPAPGRRFVTRMKQHGPRAIDWGPADGTILQAMLIPKLGGKEFDPKKLPKLTKYEQPEKKEAGVNVTQDNPDGEAIKHKSFEKKKAQVDRRRKKRPTLGALMDAPEDDDPRARATQLSEIVGQKDGSVHGSALTGRAGDIYLGKVTNSVRRSFKVPVFLTAEELKKLVVEIEIRRMDKNGSIVAYTIRRKSNNEAFNGAAIEAVKRFAPSEGGSSKLPEPSPEMLDHINRRGILIRLEGKQLR